MLPPAELRSPYSKASLIIDGPYFSKILVVLGKKFLIEFLAAVLAFLGLGLDYFGTVRAFLFEIRL